MPDSFCDNYPNIPLFNGNIIAYMNPRKAVGKTTCCYNITTAMHRLSKSSFSLLIDLDPQANLTEYCGLYEGDYEGSNICSLFESRCDPFDCCYSLEHVDPNYRLFIIPGSQYLAVTLNRINENPDLILNFKANVAKLLKVFANVGIDCESSLSNLVRAAMIVSNRVAIPVIPDSNALFSVMTISSMANKIKNSDKRLNNAALNSVDVILNNCDGSYKQKRFIQDISFEHEIIGSITERKIIGKTYPVVAEHPTSMSTMEFYKVAERLRQ